MFILLFHNFWYLIDFFGQRFHIFVDVPKKMFKKCPTYHIKTKCPWNCNITTTTKTTYEKKYQTFCPIFPIILSLHFPQTVAYFCIQSFIFCSNFVDILFFRLDFLICWMFFIKMFIIFSEFVFVCVNPFVTFLCIFWIFSQSFHPILFP